MHKRSIFSTAGFGTLVLAGAMFISSCSNKITEEQMAQLDGLRRDEAQLNESLSKVRSEKSRLESELNAKKAELKKCDDEVAFIKAKLATWPDVWPDWKPEQK